MVNKETILAAYNAEYGSDLTFAELGKQLAMKELEAYYRKMLKNAIIQESIV